MQDEYEDRYLDTPLTGQTFRYSEHSPAVECTPETTPKQSAKRLELIYLPDTRRVSEDETTTVGVRTRESCFSLPATPDKQITWSKAFPLPTLEERRWHQSNSIQAKVVPINVSGEIFDKHASSRHSLFNTETAVNPKSTLRRRRTIIGIPTLSQKDQDNVNGITPIKNTSSNTEARSTPCEAEVNGRHLPVQAVSPQPLPPPLRKTISDLGQVVQSHICQTPSRMDSTAIMYANPACNGPRDAAYSPSWQEGSFSYMSPSSPPATPSNQANDSVKCSAQSNSRASLNLNSPMSVDGGDSVFASTEDPEKNNGVSIFTYTIPISPMAVSPQTEDSKLTFLPIQQEEEGSALLQSDENACTYRERSMSMPTDSGSLSSVDIVFSENRRGSGNYALSYPSGSSEESTSTENISMGVEQDDLEKKRRSRNISLKKAKKKPSPPTRSVSLIKDGNVQKKDAFSKDQRPKSLCISFDNQENSFAHDIQDNATLPMMKDAENVHLSQHWYLPDWKANDPYRSLSGSSTATGTTVIECAKTRGSSESLTSLSISRATTPSQLSIEAESKISSPGRPPGLMSPSSGYSSQSETPTPTIPTSMILGHSPYQTCRVRPMVPERKSSLPAVSPIERSPKCRLPFELPVTPPTLLDFSSIRIVSKGKPKVSRHHSDSTFGLKLGPKTSPVQPIMPMVTQSDLRSVRLRSVSKSEPEDNIDLLEHLDEQAEDVQPEDVFPLPEKKVKPPVAEKPPMSKRPQNLTLKPHSISHDSSMVSPISPHSTVTVIKGKTLPHDIYTVIRKPKHKKNQEAKCHPAPSPSAETSFPPDSYLSQIPSVVRASQRNADEEELSKIKHLPERITVQSMNDHEKKKVKIPPPIPKKPSVLYIPITSSPVTQIDCTPDQRLTPSPIITLEKEDPCFPDVSDFEVPDEMGKTSNAPVSRRNCSDASLDNSPNFNNTDSEPGYCFSGSSTEAIADTSHVRDKTAESIDDEDDVFIASRTTEDLFTVIHRSKRKLLGWKEPGDTFSGRSSSHSPVKNTPSSPTNESPIAVCSTVKTSSKTEDFKALLQRKGSKTSLGSRTSAAELLKSTNPLARRVMNEFAQDLENNNSAKPQP